MVHTFFHGVFLGLGLAVLFIGPSLFALIQCSITNGFRSAAVMAFGISLSDVFLVALSYLGASQLLDNPRNIMYMRAIGSLILFGFGIFTLFQKHEGNEQEVKGKYAAAIKNGNHLPIMFVKGFFLNLFNPAVLFFWISWVGVASAQYTTRKEVLAFFVGTLGTVFATDLLKSFAAKLIKKLLTPKIMKFIHYLMGIALIICGIVLLYQLLQGKVLSAA